ncbi:MAG TPA: HAMP domain-containing sensor histidine kinase [Gemmatimonadaceae bacterium]|nr:HAMP domain-containing sensor histidine kinase [Gemmatimonadaceae bacterium]
MWPAPRRPRAADPEVVGRAHAWRALMAAGGQVSGRWALDARDESLVDGVGAFVAELTATVWTLATGGTAAALTCPVRVPARRLLEAVRAAFIQLTADAAGVDLRPTLRVLAAFEEAQRLVDADGAGRFTEMLAGRDGLALVVEVAHDMRAPLSSILLLVETLKRGRSGVVNAVQERQLGLVYSAAFELSLIANDAIELAHGGARLMDRRPVPFSVAEIFRAVREIVHPMAEEKGLALDLTPPSVDLRTGHAGVLHRVVLNLVTNALKFTREGRVAVDVAELSRTRVRFAVKDTGPGMSAEVVRRLFAPLREGKQPGEYSFSSAGLGLAICRTLVGALGSELLVESGPGLGTRFFFDLELPPAARL